MQEIQLAQQQRVFFDKELSAGAGDKTQQAPNVAITSEQILQAMGRITGLYEKPG